MKISKTIFDKYDELTSLMLDVNVFGVNCKLVYTDKIQKIQTNTSQLKQKKILNLQQIAPPNEFGRAEEDFKIIEVTEDIILRVYWTQKDFKKFANVNLPDGSIMTIGNYSDLSKINRAIALVIQTSKTDHQEWRFEKSGEPAVHGLTGKQLMCFWRRI
jgi:hypothetical protein